mgnify:CR=1 FL=1
MKKNKKEIICLICCRGGSSKIKNKNIKKFCGKALLTWSINNIIQSGVFDRIILSTDSKKIGKIGTKHTLVELPGLRPKRLATNNSDLFETHKYIFNKLKDKFTDVFKTGLKLQSVKLWETPSSYALYDEG